MIRIHNFNLEERKKHPKIYKPKIDAFKNFGNMAIGHY